MDVPELQNRAHGSVRLGDVVRTIPEQVIFDVLNRNLGRTTHRTANEVARALREHNFLKEEENEDSADRA